VRKNEQLLKLHPNVSTDKMQGKRRFDKGRSFPYNHLFLVVETCHVITISLQETFHKQASTNLPSISCFRKLDERQIKTCGKWSVRSVICERHHHKNSGK
jgi:hypothetical protein